MSCKHGKPDFAFCKECCDEINAEGSNSASLAGSISERFYVDAAVRKLWAAFQTLKEISPESVSDADIALWEQVIKHDAVQVVLNKK